MLSALRIGRYPVLASPLPGAKVSSISSSSSAAVGGATCAACFCAAAEPQKKGGGAMEGQSRRPKQDEMITCTNPMAESFGEVYATRCDEEGFGGIYGGNQTLRREGEDDLAAGYEESQGSGVKKKEEIKGRRNETETTTTA